MNTDKISMFLLRSLDILFIQSQVRTAYTFILCTFIYLGLGTYPVILEILQAKDNGTSKLFFCTGFFILFNFKPIKASIFGKYVDEETEKALHLIEISGLSNEQKKMHTASLLNKVIEKYGTDNHKEEKKV